MTVAAKLAAEGCPHGTIVGADEQTAGVGTHGRTWHSEKGSGLYVSIVLRLPRALPVVMLALGLATREAIAKTTGLKPDLRWPNDVLLGGSKCAGILAQMEAGAIIAGIGINISQAAFPPDLDATSLLLAGAAATREDILMELVPAVDRYCGQEPEKIMRAFEAASSYACGLRVRVEQSGGAIEGVTCGLDPWGFLVIRQDDGRDATILAGGVRPCS